MLVIQKCTLNLNFSLPDILDTMNMYVVLCDNYRLMYKSSIARQETDQWAWKYSNIHLILQRVKVTISIGFWGSFPYLQCWIVDLTFGHLTNFILFAFADELKINIASRESTIKLSTRQLISSSIRRCYFARRTRFHLLPPKFIVYSIARNVG